MPSTLTAGQCALIENELLAREHALEAELRALAEQAGASSDSRTALASQILNDDPEAAREHPDDRAVVLARADQLRQEQADIGNALIALREGRLGACADCGESIAFDRLKAQPMAPRCLRCQTAFEAA